MFLNRRENGFWYLWYEDANGKLQKVSTRKRFKGEALQFAKEFINPAAKRHTISPSGFIKEYCDYSSAIHTTETKKVFSYCLNHLKEFAGDISLRQIDAATAERFLADKIRQS